MRLAAGVIAPLPYALGDRDMALVQFRVSPAQLGEVDLLDSGGAPPGRYAGEVLRRLRRLCPEAALYLAVNPQLGVPPACLQQVLRAARGADPGAHACWVVTDRDEGRPLAYVLRADALDRCPPVHLGLLSGSDADLDLAFLQASFGPAARLDAGPCRDVAAVANGFLGPVNPAMHEATRRATALLLAQRDDAARAALVLHGERAALVGFHAGDVLFVVQALSLEQTSFRSVVVPRDYADIVTCLRPDLTALVVDLPVPQRGAYQVGDELALLRDYILQLERQGVSTARFFHMVRPILRDHNRTRHHLREIAAFAVGGEGHRLRPPPPVPEEAAIRRDSGRPGKVVVQFDAGWMLKGYPRDRRGELLRLLRQRGHDLLLLGAPEPDCPDVPAQPYTDLAAFRALLGSASALIGCDSFPAHFADACGVPTVALFGSTLPHSARGHDSQHYRLLHHPMPCVPCQMISACKLDGGDSCHAHATAWEVVSALESIRHA